MKNEKSGVCVKINKTYKRLSLSARIWLECFYLVKLMSVIDPVLCKVRCIKCVFAIMFNNKECLMRFRE